MKSKKAISERLSGLLALILVFLFGGFLFLSYFKAIHWFQILLYQKPGYILIGSSNIIIGILVMTLTTDFFVIDSFFRVVRKYNPEFYRKFYNDPLKWKINKEAFRKFKIALITIGLMGTGAIWFFFNEFLSLGNKEILVSKGAFISSPKAYSYSEIKIIERLSKKSDGSTVLYYTFPDGVELSNIGFSEVETSKLISQKSLGKGPF